MNAPYPEIAENIGATLTQLRKEMPASMQGFWQMNQAANQDGALSHKTKELIAMAVGIANRCQGCLAFHAQALVKLGCSRAEFIEMLQVALYMGGGPSLMTAAEALQAYESFGGEKASDEA